MSQVELEVTYAMFLLVKQQEIKLLWDPTQPIVNAAKTAEKGYDKSC